ncbi:hypothetical protein EV424DRAFT_1347076 [Suillus variegatus]|nr:hypothetical protein EV424DRAFT_1347076 [Suillus variegatus]
MEESYGGDAARSPLYTVTRTRLNPIQVLQERYRYRFNINYDQRSAPGGTRSLISSVRRTTPKQRGGPMVPISELAQEISFLLNNRRSSRDRRQDKSSPIHLADTSRHKKLFRWAEQRRLSATCRPVVWSQVMCGRNTARRVVFDRDDTPVEVIESATGYDMDNKSAQKKNMRSYQAEDQLATSCGRLAEEPIEAKIANFNFIPCAMLESSSSVIIELPAGGDSPLSSSVVGYRLQTLQNLSQSHPNTTPDRPWATFYDRSSRVTRLAHAFSVGRNRAAANPLKYVFPVFPVSSYLRSQTINPTLKEVLSGHHRRG